MALIDNFTDWVCPECGLKDRTRNAGPHTRMHTCPKLYGLTAPMVREGTKAHILAKEREDYVGTEKVTTDDRGRPVMSIITERPDGSNDTIVFAPLASSFAANK